MTNSQSVEQDGIVAGNIFAMLNNANREWRDSGGQKPQFWAIFDIWGTPVPTTFYRRGSSLMCRPKVYTYTAISCVFIVSASGDQKTPQFWANFDIWVVHVPTPFYR